MAKFFLKQHATVVDPEWISPDPIFQAIPNPDPTDYTRPTKFENFTCK